MREQTCGSIVRTKPAWREPNLAWGLQWILVLLVIVMTGCADIGDGNGSDTTAGVSNATPAPPPAPIAINSEQAFAQTVYPLVRGDGQCFACHSGNGPGRPDFAHPDVTAAFNEVMDNQKVDLNTPDKSRLVQRLAVDSHNCWSGAAGCADNAQTMQRAIEDWAALIEDSGLVPQRIASATASLSDGAQGGPARVDDNVIALYAFTEGSGDVARDTSGVGMPMDLTLTGMEWVEGGGIRNVSGKAQASADASRKLFDLIAEGNDEYTIEAWIIPDNVAQNGPARIVSYSRDTGNRNFTMGQVDIYYDFRNRSADLTGNNGTPSLSTEPTPSVATELQHVVFTVDQTSGRKIYLNGEFLGFMDGLPAGQLDWNSGYNFVLGNEVTDNRLWQGVFKAVAIHSSALTDAQVKQNFDAGTGTKAVLRFDVSQIVQAPAHIEMEVSELDGFSYLFGKPTFVGDVTGVPVKDIRIAVNNTVPVAGQAFRNVNVMVDSSQQELSRLGSVIRKDEGPENDMFFPTFGTLADRSVAIPEAAPRAPSVNENVEPSPDLGLRTFSQINDTMAALTGVDPNRGNIRSIYADLRQALPATPDLRTFVGAHQVGISKLALEYCDTLVESQNLRNGFFGNFPFGSAVSVALNQQGKNQIVNRLYDNMVGVNLATQPDPNLTKAELMTLVNSLTAGCNTTNANDATCGAERTRTVAKASCAATLASAAMLIN